MNKKSNFTLLLAITLTLGIALSFQSNISGKTEAWTKSDVRTLNKIINTNLNLDGGYHNLPNVSIYEKDYVYFTYYSLLSLQLLDSDSMNENSIELSSNIKQIQDILLIDPNNFDNVSNIYYYLEILKMLDIEIDRNKKIQLTKYILDLQTKVGSFGFSESHKQKIDSGGYESGSNDEVFLSTYLALEALDTLGVSPKDTVSIKKWVESRFDEVKSEAFYLNKLPYLLMLLKTESLLGNIDNKHAKLLDEYYNHSLQDMISKYNESKQLDIILLNDLLECSLVLGKESDFINETSFITQHYLNLQNFDGCFAMSQASESNILSTYIILRHMKLSHNEIPNKDITLKTIQNTQTVDGYFLPIISRPSTFQASYYTYKIAARLNLDNEDEVKENISRFLKNTSRKNIESPFELAYYLKLEKDITGSVSKNLISNTDILMFKDRLKNNSFARINDYYDAIDSLEALDMLGEELESETCEHIIDKIKNSNDGDENFIYSCLKLQLFKLLGQADKEAIKTRIDYINSTLEKDYSKIDSELRVYYLYLAIETFEKMNLDSQINVNKEIVYKDLLDRKTKYSYKLNVKNYPTIESIFICTYIIEKIKL